MMIESFRAGDSRPASEKRGYFVLRLDSESEDHTEMYVEDELTQY